MWMWRALAHAVVSYYEFSIFRFLARDYLFTSSATNGYSGALRLLWDVLYVTKKDRNFGTLEPPS